MSALEPNALSKFIGQLFVAPFTTGTPVFTRFGSVRALANKNTYEKTEIKADDTGVVVTFTKPECIIECTFLENADTDVLDLIVPGTEAIVAASPVVVTTEILLDHPTIATWAANQVLPLLNKNGDNTVVTAVTIDHAGTPLVDGTDYELVLQADGTTGVVRIGAALTLTGDIDADYTYTPNAKKTFTFTKEQLVLPQLIVKIEAEDPDNPTKFRRITLTDCVFNGEYAQEFLDVVEAGDITGSSLSFDLNDSGIYLYEDEINTT